MHLSPSKLLVSLLAAGSLVSITSPASADGKNEVRAVTFDEDGGGVTRVHVRADQTPTFTVYKLERPSRVVIDVPQAHLAEAVRGHESTATFTAGTWAVGNIAAQELDDGGSVVRVIVTLARPGRYDVKTEGSEVVVSVEPRDPKPASASPADLAAARAQADQARKAQSDAERAMSSAQAEVGKAQAEAGKAKDAASSAQAEAERLRKAAADQAARADAAQRAAELARQQGAANSADVERAKQQAAAATAEAAKMKDAATAAQADADRAHAAADKARTEALARAAAADQAKNAALAQAAAAQADADRTKAELDREHGQLDRQRAEVVAARTEVQQAKHDAQQAKDDAAQAKNDAQAARSEAEAARAEAERVRTQAVAAKAQAAAAKQRADVAKQQADDEKRQAEADRKQAETERLAAEHAIKDTQTKLAELDKRTQAAQDMQDKARAANAAAEVREQAAQAAVAQADETRKAAEAAARRAAELRDRSSNQAKSDRDRLTAEAKAAELRLADAKRLADAAEARRADAEDAATTAKRELEHTRGTLATVEQQRTEAETAAQIAARKRSEAEAAAGDAARRRGEAETAAQLAARKRSEAESAAAAATQRRGEAEAERLAAEEQRKAAEDAARVAQAAAVAADHQRAIAETAAQHANDATRTAEASLGSLNAKREAAEQAAQELEARSKAEAAAQAELIAAKARKAGEDEVARARAEATRLIADRKHAEDDLAARRKDVAAQQAEADRLKTAAAAARDAADREEARRAKLAQQRAAEEQELARLQQQKTDAQRVVVLVPAQPPVAAVHPVVTVQPVVAMQPVKATTSPVAATSPLPSPSLSTSTTMRSAKRGKAIITAVDFRGDGNGGEVDVAVSGSASVQVGEVTATHAELVIDNAELAAQLERTLDVSKFGGPVASVSSFRDRRAPDRVRLVAELSQPAQPTFARNGESFRWTFANIPQPDRTAAVTIDHHTPHMQDIQPTVVGGFGAASTPVAQQSVSQVIPNQHGQRRVYHGAPVDFDFKDAPIHDLLRAIADTGHVNIVIPQDIDAKVTVRLKRVPWDQALEVILSTNGLWYRHEGNLYRISTRKQLDAEDEEEAKRRAAMIQAEAPEPEIVTLNYASAEDMKTKLEPLLSPKGKIEVDARTNSLIINDVRGNRQRAQALALQLDTQTPQISIEARVVEANSTFNRQFGIQWGGNALAGAAAGNSTGLLFPSTLSLIGANTDSNTNSTGVATPSNFAINLPAATGNGEGGALGLSLGSIAGNLNVNLRLSALEDSGTVRIISAPKVTVLNGIEAKISQGVSIPIQVLSAAGTNTQFVQADLSLTVKPYVSQRDCAIAMNLIVTKNEPDFANTGARGDPTILRKEARTTMLVQDGDTTVLGGIYTRNTSVSLKKFPFLGDLPVIGWLFKNRSEIDNRTEVLVFITPKITNKASLRCQQ
jgi:type IV pilus assembly protein PilQ